MARATEIDVAVAFIKTTGIRLLMPDLLAALQLEADGTSSNRRVRVLTSDYLDVTDPEALRLAPAACKSQGADVRVYDHAGKQLPPQGLRLRADRTTAS